MKNAFDIVRDFEQAIAEYTGAPYVIAVNSCTNALFLCLKYHYNLRKIGFEQPSKIKPNYTDLTTQIEIPKLTYLSVPMQIIHVGYGVRFREENWEGMYQLKPFNIWDAARRFMSNMFADLQYYHSKCDMSVKHYVCTSHHWSKILGVQQGGCILHDDSEFDKWARKARFDGRTEGVKPKDDKPILGYHMYLSPEIAAEGLVRLMHLPKNNPDLPNDDYPDLSQMEIFK